MHLLDDSHGTGERLISYAQRTVMTVPFLGGSADGKTMNWPRDVRLPAWICTGASGGDYYRVDESTGAPRYLHASMVMGTLFADMRSSSDVPTEIKNNSPAICADTLGQFPVLTRERGRRENRFELWIHGRLVGYFPTRELAERTGRRVVQLQHHLES